MIGKGRGLIDRLSVCWVGAFEHHLFDFLFEFCVFRSLEGLDFDRGTGAVLFPEIDNLLKRFDLLVVAVADDGDNNPVPELPRVPEFDGLCDLAQGVDVLPDGVQLVLVIYFDVHLIIDMEWSIYNRMGL